MTPGVSIQGVTALAAWTLATGAADANYPVSNLADIVNVANVARVTPAAGIVSLKFNLTSAATIQFLAMVRHNAAAGSARFRLWSGPNQTGTNVVDSGSVSIWAGGAIVQGYSPCRPYVAPAAVSAQSGQIDFASLTGVLEMGALEISQWWPWPGVSEGADIGFSTRQADVVLAGGAAEAGDVFTPRIYNGQVDYLDLPTAQTTALDFQKMKSLRRPLVFVQDYDDPTTWGRGCFLARNSELPAMVGALYRHDRFQFRLSEHFR